MKILLLFIFLSLSVSTFSCEKVMHKMALPIGAKYTDVYIPIRRATLNVQSIEKEGVYCLEVEISTDNEESGEFNYKFEASDEAIKIPFYALSAPEVDEGKTVFIFEYDPIALRSNKIKLKVEILSPYGGTKARLNEKFTVKH